MATTEREEMQYELLSDDSNGFPPYPKLDQSSTPPSRGTRFFVPSIAILVVLALRGAAGLFTDVQHFLSIHKPLSCDCGNSAAEALSMGCKFDILATAWLPQHCRDDELTELFKRAGPGPNGEWPYFLDKNGTIPTTIEEVSLLPIGTHWWSVFDWHVQHCLFYWRKQYRAQFRDNIVEGVFDNEHHIIHCGKEFRKRTPLMDISTRAGVSVHSDHSLAESMFTKEQKAMFSMSHELAKVSNYKGRIEKDIE